MKTTVDITALKAHALSLWHQDKTTASELGRTLVALREALRFQRGAFTEWRKENKFTQARVSYCMRLANGKAAAAKRPRTHAQAVVSQLKKDVDKCLKLWANPSHSPVLEQVEASLSKLVLLFIGGFSGMRNMPIDLKGAKVMAAEENFKASLTKLFDAAFNPINSDDLDRIHPDLILAKGDFRQALSRVRQRAQSSQPSSVKTKTA